MRLEKVYNYYPSKRSKSNYTECILNVYMYSKYCVNFSYLSNAYLCTSLEFTLKTASFFVINSGAISEYPSFGQIVCNRQLILRLESHPCAAQRQVIELFTLKLRKLKASSCCFELNQLERVKPFGPACCVRGLTINQS